MAQADLPRLARPRRGIALVKQDVLANSNTDKQNIEIIG